MAKPYAELSSVLAALSIARWNLTELFIGLAAVSIE